MVGDEVVAHGRLVARRRRDRVERAGGEDRLGGQPPGEQRLADALAGHHVAGHRRVAGQEDSTVGQPRPVDAAGDRPRRVPVLRSGRRAERGADVRAVEQAGPQLLHVLDAAGAVAQHAEADVRPPAGQRERPGVAGEQVGVEPHVEVVAGAAVDAADVLAEGVPLAEVARLAEAERLAHRAPHAVGGDDVAGGDRLVAVEADDDVVAAVGDRAVEAVALEHAGAGLDGDVDEGVVELQAGGDGGVGAGARRAAARAPRAPTASAARRRRRPASRRPTPGRTRVARARGGPASSARHRSTCRAGRRPCRRRRRHARRRRAARRRRRRPGPPRRSSTSATNIGDQATDRLQSSTSCRGVRGAGQAGSTHSTGTHVLDWGLSCGA